MHVTDPAPDPAPSETGSEQGAPRRSAAAPPPITDPHRRAVLDRLARHAPERPLILAGVELHDGLGSPALRADVVIRDGSVSAIRPREPGMCDPGTREPETGVDVVDASGLALLPGFVDIHTHSDLTLLSDPLGRSKLLQGVTCEIVGNCGLGLAPLGPEGARRTSAADLRGVNSYLDRDPAVRTEFPSLADHLAALESARPALNVGALVAHIPLHAAVTGLGESPSTPAQVAQIAALAREAIADGALGISTGLVYAPLCFVAEDELMALGRVAAETGTLLAWHVRDYIDDLAPSIEQALRVAEATGCRTQISHLQVVGQRNWEVIGPVLTRIRDCRRRGLDAGMDMYPYLAGNAPLSQILPPWVQSGGDGPLRERLADPATRARVHAEMTAPPGSAMTDAEIVVAASPDAAANGRSLADLARADGDGTDAALELLARHGTAVQMVAHGRSREVLDRVLGDPACVVASDGLALDPDGPTGRAATHPRSYGTFPRYLGDAARDRTGEGSEEPDGAPARDRLPDAVRRCTSAPADRVGLHDRGRVQVGSPADLVLADLDALADRATYTAPHQHPAGILAVLVAGVPAALDGAATGARRGAVLHGPRSPRG